jgi:hypothetical protein
MQVHTPPASAGTARSISHGFFLDPSPSVNDQKPGVASADQRFVSSVAPRPTTKAQITPRRKREWWDEIETSLVSDAPVIKAQIDSVIMGQIEPPKFEEDTPEHLPNCPLCALFQKEKHGGSIGDRNDICVYHGRK